MQLRYSSRDLERTCTESRIMQKRLGAQVAKALQLRLSEVRAVREFSDLLLGTGRWEQLLGDRAGQWSARLSANWRLIVLEDAEDQAIALIVEVVDYHKR